MGGCFECCFNVCINLIEYVGPPSCKIHMLEKVGENLLHVCLVEVPSNNEYSLRIRGLQLVDVVIQSIQGSLCVCVRRDVDINDRLALDAKTSMSGEQCE